MIRKAHCIEGIVVAKHTTRQGVTSALYEHLEKILREKGIACLFAFVVTSPVTNCPSIIFHTKRGFQRISSPKAKTLFNIKNYGNVLFFKELP